MRVGVYIDGFNLYYGGRTLSRHASSAESWKWIDPRALSERVLEAQLRYAESQDWSTLVEGWRNAKVDRVVYCTARIDSSQNPSGFRDQDIYLKALKEEGSVDHIEYGSYVSRAKVAPLARRVRRSSAEHAAPEVVRAEWPVMVKDQDREDVPQAIFMVQYLHNEEKGSDVNVATHMIADVLQDKVDAVVLMSNDSDLRLPVALVRDRVPVGVVNPRGRQTAGDLRPPGSPGASIHWSRRLRLDEILQSQLANPLGRYWKPEGW